MAKTLEELLADLERKAKERLGKTSPVKDAGATVYDSDATVPESAATVYEGDATVLEDNATVYEAAAVSPVSEPSYAKGEMLLGTYTVESSPIHGGMGSVWRVHHKGWNVDLAMKRPQAKLFQSDVQKGNFIEECKAWINLGLHPNIVSCYYVREIDGVPTIFSEWMENGSLENHIQKGTLYTGTGQEQQERLLDIAIQFARGLHYAHEQGLIHQDVKPDNLLLSNDWDAKVADFGLAKARAQLTVLEGVNTMIDAGATVMAPSGGYTPAYCSMEQMDGKPLTRRTDIYSWAVSVMEMYLGERLWDNGVVAGFGCETYFPDCRVKMPEELKTLLKKCLAAQPEDRPHDFAEIEAELQKIYRAATGSNYPHTESLAAADTPDSLNNRALSYLDMGYPEQASQIWQKIDREGHIESIYNDILLKVQTDKMGLQGAVQTMAERSKTVSQKQRDKAKTLTEKMRILCENSATECAAASILFPGMDNSEDIIIDEKNHCALIACRENINYLCDLTSQKLIAKYDSMADSGKRIRIRHVQLDETHQYIVIVHFYQDAIVNRGWGMVPGFIEIFHIQETDPFLTRDDKTAAFLRYYNYYDAVIVSGHLICFEREPYALRAYDLTKELEGRSCVGSSAIYSIELQGESSYFELHFTQDGKHLVTVEADSFAIYDTLTGKLLQRQKLHNEHTIYDYVTNWKNCVLDSSLAYFIYGSSLYDLKHGRMSSGKLFKNSSVDESNQRFCLWKNGDRPEFLLWENYGTCAEKFILPSMDTEFEYSLSHIRSTNELLRTQKLCRKEMDELQLLLKEDRFSEALEKWRNAKAIPDFSEMPEFNSVLELFDQRFPRVSVEKCRFDGTFSVPDSEHLVAASNGYLLMTIKIDKGEDGRPDLSTFIRMRDSKNGTLLWELDLTNTIWPYYSLSPDNAEISVNAGILALYMPRHFGNIFKLGTSKTVLCVIDLKSGKVLETKKFSKQYHHLLSREDGEVIYLTNGVHAGDETVFLSGRALRPLRASADDSAAFVSLYKKKYGLESLSSDTVKWLDSYKSDEPQSDGLRYTSDGMLALAKKDGIILIDIQKHEEVSILKGFDSAIFDRNGKAYYAMNDDGEITRCCIQYDY